MIVNLGFMQGRLSPIENNQIQSFPWDNWEHEIAYADKLGFNIIEWTLDQENIYSNPFMNTEGQTKIKMLKKSNNVSIESLTADCFMQAPFWKSENTNEKKMLQDIFIDVISAAKKLDIKYIIVPLVDNGSIDSASQEDDLVNFLISIEKILGNTKILFESDLPPKKLEKFIGKFSEQYFGINYDTGNSASLGYDPAEEFFAYGNRILNVHLKDRPLGGSTVPLGEGDTDFSKIFNLLSNKNYSSNLILQAARAKDDNHDQALLQYKNYIFNVLKKNGIKHKR
tara:strand:+ start:6750 stop:7598 length:849 start_codon:yes stop_codon:yes gene_type:complete